MGSNLKWYFYALMLALVTNGVLAVYGMRIARKLTTGKENANSCPFFILESLAKEDDEHIMAGRTRDYTVRRSRLAITKTVLLFVATNSVSFFLACRIWL
jgi:hypothetical protein